MQRPCAVSSTVTLNACAPHSRTTRCERTEETYHEESTATLGVRYYSKRRGKQTFAVSRLTTHGSNLLSFLFEFGSYLREDHT